LPRRASSLNLLRKLLRIRLAHCQHYPAHAHPAADVLVDGIWGILADGIHYRFRIEKSTLPGDHGRLLYACNHGFIHRPRCRNAQRMAIQTPFAKKLTRSKDCNDRFLTLLGNDGKLDLALLDVKNRVRNRSL
jgi:hypothetical protein